MSTRPAIVVAVLVALVSDGASAQPRPPAVLAAARNSEGFTGNREWDAGLLRWGIPERSLPAGAVQVRTASAWEQHRTIIVATGCVLALQLALIVALLSERAVRRRAEIARRDGAARAEIAGVSLGVGFWMWEPESDRVWITRQCASLLGTETGKPLTLRAFLDALRRQSDEPAAEAIERAVRDGTAVDAEWRVSRGDGDVRWIAASTRPGVESRGRHHVTGVLQDVTARKAAELRAVDQRKMLSHLDRVAMLGEMAGALAHELRQPLTAIMSYAQGTRRVIDTQPPDLDRAKHGLEAIVKADQRAGEVVDRVRKLLERTHPQTEAVSINDAVRETLALASPELCTGAVVATTHLADDLPQVCGDRFQLQQVLMNVVLNACDAMDVVARGSRRLALTTSYDEQQVQILVRDSGAGLAEDRLEAIFEPFVTTKPGSPGLGLAICRSIVRAHGGEIRASSHPEGGSTFRILLPRAAGGFES